MPTEEEINYQQELLAAHRQTLAHYLKQLAQLGEAHVPPGITVGIRESRENIQRIKKILRQWNAVVDDHPDDEPYSVSGSAPARPFPGGDIELPKVSKLTFTLQQAWIQWTLANTIGWSISRVVGWYLGALVYKGGTIDLGGGARVFASGVAIALDTITFGLVISFFQWLVLRKLISRANLFLILSIIGWVVFGAISRIIGGLVGGILLGLILGLLQFIPLRNSTRQATRWSIATALGYSILWTLNGFLSSIIYTSLGGSPADILYTRAQGWMIAVTLAGAIAGAIFGAITGGVLAWLLHTKQNLMAKEGHSG